MLLHITKITLLFLVPLFTFSILLLVLYPKFVTGLSHDSHYVMHKCEKTNDTYISGSTFQSALNDILFSKLPAKVLQATFYSFTNGTGIDQVNALYYCRGNVGGLACHNCAQAAADKIIAKCEFIKEAVVWFEECTLRYANRSISSIDEEYPMYIYTNKSGIMNDHLLDPFKDKFDSAMDEVIKQAVYSINLQGFATTQVNLSSSEVLHCVVQCTPDIIGAPCDRCLRSALNQRDKWADTMVFMPSCFMRVDLYNSATPPISIPTGPQGLPKIIIVVIALACAIVAAIVVVLSYFCHYPDLQAVRSAIVTIAAALFSCFRNDPVLEVVEQGVASNMSQSGTLPECPRVLMEFTYEQLVTATNNFCRRRYLGEGSFARVYEGVLEGKKVAIKELKEQNYQGTDAFLSEVNINFRANHRNIVKVVGYCNEGNHQLLVYELVENNCVRKHLQGTGKEPGNLSWENRMKIAVGTAKGLEYLHETCNPRIIHRDIKPSNILLDINYEPKLADFGLAKVFPDSAIYVSTLAKGTFGYLDPEYFDSHKLTQKSDVYSFGFVLLEFITGKGPTTFNDLRNALLSLLQGLPNSASDGPKDDSASNGPNNPAIKIDPNLNENYVANEMDCMIICSALCVHHSSQFRLDMSQVVKLLNDRSLPRSQLTGIIANVGSSSSANTYPETLGLDDLKILAIRVLKTNTFSGSSMTSITENPLHDSDLT